MIRHRTFSRARRRGATVVEFAVVAPLLFLLLFGLIIGGLGVFRYQEVALLAREGTRYASVHGARYQTETGKSAATPDDVYKNAILPKAVILDPKYFTYNVAWDNPNKQPRYVDANRNVKTNRVRVTVTYQWFPEAYLFGPITLSSTSEMPLSY